MRTYERKPLSREWCINDTMNRHGLSKAAAEALFYDEINGKLPIGLSVTKAKTYLHYTVIFQSSDEQAEFEIPAACLNYIHSRKFFDLGLTQEKGPYVWRNNLIRNTQPGYSNYFSSFFSSCQEGESFDDSYSAADNGLQGLGLT